MRPAGKRASASAAHGATATRASCTPKADADIIAVRPLLDLPNVTLLVNAEAERTETDPAGGAVTGVEVSRDGDHEIYTGDIVVLAAGAANSARILRRSVSDRHTAGLANGSDQVGRNYMYHNSKAVVALDKEPNDTVFQKTLALNDFYLAGNGRDWPLGNSQMLGKSNAMAMKGEEPKLTKIAPHWSLDETAHHAVDFWLTTEDVVAVGTALAGGPPRRSQRAGLPHWAPTSGEWRPAAARGRDASRALAVATVSGAGSSAPRSVSGLSGCGAASP